MRNALGLALYAMRSGGDGHDRAAAVPGPCRAQQALPTLLLHGVPPVVGAIGLAAVFSAELSAADAVLFMLTTSLSQDFYKRFVRPDASEAAGLADHPHHGGLAGAHRRPRRHPCRQTSSTR